MKYIIFGGAFDPIHIGHLHKAQQVLNATGYGSVLFMPAYDHQFDKSMTPSIHRAMMVGCALSDFKDHRLATSSFEIINGLNGSTMEMFRLFFKESGLSPDEVGYLIGMDQANLIDKWDQWEELISTVPFIVTNRAGVKMEKDWFLKRPHRFIYTPKMDISSTDIRRKLKSGEDVRELTAKTLWYIKEHELYV